MFCSDSFLSRPAGCGDIAMAINMLEHVYYGDR